MAERTLYEIAHDVAKQGLDDETARAMLEGFIHDFVWRTFGPDLPRMFGEALGHVKAQLQPCGGAFSDVWLARLLGTEIAWLRESANRPAAMTAEQLEKMRSDYVSSVMYGESELTDSESVYSRLTEMSAYLRTWADFPAFGFGIPMLDDAFGGILPGEVCVLAGAPGTMKTSLALAAVDDYITRADAGPVYYCSADMAPREIVMRLVERETQVPEIIIRQMIARGDPDVRRMYGAAKDKYGARLAIAGHAPGRYMTLQTMLHDCLKRQPQLVVIDYLTRLKAIGQSDLEFVEEAMPAIIAHAHQYQTSFLVLSQMGRASRSEQASGRVGGHSKGGGIVEELAHSEIELVQQARDGDKPLVIACLTKARHGQSGQYFALDYDGPCKRFSGDAQRMAREVKRGALYTPRGNGFYDDFLTKK